MIETDSELLRKFTRDDSHDAFEALVKRHLNLVYSAALRQVCSPDLAQEVAQTVFIQLASKACKLKPDTVLSAWLYTVTRNTAVDTVRREARRQAREKLATDMSNQNAPPPEWTQIGPVLDEAMASLKEEDRTAILLRFFENKSLREVGESIGTSEDAAQKRVSRALDQLKECLSRQGITVGAGGMTMLLCNYAVQAAPAGLAAVIASGALVPAASVAAGTAAVSLTKTIAMTTLQKTAIALIVTGAAAVGFFQTARLSKARAKIEQMQQQQAEHATLQQRVQQLEKENARASNALAALSTQAGPAEKSPREVLKLRGEVGRLRVENAAIASTNAVSKITANPESRNMLRNQQKMGMTALYKEFAKTANLTSEQTEKLNDLLADQIMANVDRVTQVLRDKPEPEQINRIFAADQANHEARVEELIGAEGLAQYKEYTRNLLSTVSVQQFMGMLSVADEVKPAKREQLLTSMKEQVRAVLAEAQLPEDYQLIPMLNFRNIASEQEGERSLRLLESVYTRLAAEASSFLTPDELKKLEEFRTAAVTNNRSALMLNRTMMAPISE